MRQGVRLEPKNLVLSNAYRMAAFQLRREYLFRQQKNPTVAFPPWLEKEPLAFLEQLDREQPGRETKLNLALAWVDLMLLFPALEIKAPSSVESVNILTKLIDGDDPYYVPALYGRGLNHLHRPARLVWPESKKTKPDAAVQDIGRAIAVGRKFGVGSARLQATLAIALGDSYIKAGRYGMARSWWQVAQNLSGDAATREAVRRRYGWQDEEMLDRLEEELDHARAVVGCADDRLEDGVGMNTANLSQNEFFPAPRGGRIHLVVPKLSDPRVMVAIAQTLWVVLGATTYYFNRDPFRLGMTVGTACLLDIVIAFVARREILVPISAYLTALSIGILLESYDWRIYPVAALWGIASKYLVRNKEGHFFNPSNFGLVMALLLCPHIASIAPGSQWGADYRIAAAIIVLGLLMMYRIRRLELALAWLGGYVAMSLLRMALGQGGLVFALGPMTGAEFALFTFVMLPDPKASPPTRKGRIAWGLSIAVLDGVMRYFEIRYSPFYSLFICCATLPIIRWVAVRGGLREAELWKHARIAVTGDRAGTPTPPPVAAEPAASPMAR